MALPLKAAAAQRRPSSGGGGGAAAAATAAAATASTAAATAMAGAGGGGLPTRILQPSGFQNTDGVSDQSVAKTRTPVSGKVPLRMNLDESPLCGHGDAGGARSMCSRPSKKHRLLSRCFVPLEGVEVYNGSLIMWNTQENRFNQFDLHESYVRG